MTKLAIQIENAKPVLSIAHMASKSIYYCVEEAEIGRSKVSVSFFNENDSESEIENSSIPTQDLIVFANDFYSDVIDFERGGEHVQEQAPAIGIEYLKENLTQVVTDYLNK